MEHAVEVEHLVHSYGTPRRSAARLRPAAGQAATGARPPALNDVSFEVARGEMFCLLGPNGSGKSTLFRILSTLMKQTFGTVRVFGGDLGLHLIESRRKIGVVFQHPSLDQKLTAYENLYCQGQLYGLGGAALRAAIGEILGRVGMGDRANELIEKLSGGMQRRVELAKALLHKPQLLILDEPSTGLDPGARKDFDGYLKELCAAEQVTVLLTTHLLDEADQCDRIGILDGGSLVALGSPAALKEEIGGDVVSITAPEPDAVGRLLRESFGGTPQVIGKTVRIERANGHEFIPQLVRAYPGRIDSVTYSKPTLEDVFIGRTGHRFWDREDEQHG
ncbi:MAG TPA: ABC transporter ATP-binding protein [Bacteroidota bacterium]|jgi:ABC-2 type transport system ATP-binding protein